jgi:hypothetical protein
MAFDPRALEAAANDFAEPATAATTEAPAETAATDTVDQPVSEIFKKTKTADREIAVANKRSRVDVPGKIQLPSVRTVGPDTATEGSEKEAEMKAAVRSYNTATKLHSDLTKSFALTPKSANYNASVPSDASEDERPAHAYWHQAMELHDNLKEYYNQLPKRLIQVHDSMTSTADRVEKALPDLHPEHADILREGIAQLRGRAGWIRDRIGEGGVQLPEALSVLNRLVDVRSSLAGMKRPDGKFNPAVTAKRHAQIIRNLGTLESIHKRITDSPLATFVAPPISRKLITETKGAAREDLRTNEILPPHLWPRDAHSAYADFGDSREVRNPEPFKDRQGKTVRALSDPGHVWFEGARRDGDDQDIQVDARDDELYDAMRTKYGQGADVVRRMKNMRDFAENKGKAAFWAADGSKVTSRTNPRPKKSQMPLGEGTIGDLGGGILPGQRVLASDEEGNLGLTRGKPVSYVETTKQSQREDALAQGKPTETYLDVINKTKNEGAAGATQEATDTISGSESEDIGHGWLQLSTGESHVISRGNLDAMRKDLGQRHPDVLKMTDALTKAETGLSAAEQEERVSKRRAFAEAIETAKQKRERELTMAAASEGGIEGWNIEQARKGKVGLEGLEPAGSGADPRFTLRGLQKAAGVADDDDDTAVPQPSDGYHRNPRGVVDTFRAGEYNPPTTNLREHIKANGDMIRAQREIRLESGAVLIATDPRAREWRKVRQDDLDQAKREYDDSYVRRGGTLPNG